MRSRHWLTILLILGVTLTTVTATAIAGSPIGSSVNISNQSVDAVYGSVAYNPDWQEYLVVWYNDRPGNDDIQAQRVSKDGNLVGSSFFISAGTGADRRYPSVAYNSKEQEYLVVWEHYDQSTGSYSIRGRRVSPSGGMISGEFTIFDPSPDLALEPAVAYAYTENKYLIVWTWVQATGTHIAGKTLTVSGGSASLGSTFLISEDTTGTEPRTQPDLAYNRARNEFLVVWREEFSSSDHDIYAQRVKMAGGEGLLGNPLVIWSSGSSDDENPAVAAIPKPSGTGQYLVVWELRTSSSGGDIWGAMVTGDGQAVTPLIIATSTKDLYDPAVAGSESGEDYLVVWSHSDYYPGWAFIPIVGQEISMGGDLVGEEKALFGSFAGHPAIASGPLADFLVVFDDKPLTATNRDIYGQLWGNRLYIPLTLRNK